MAPSFEPFGDYSASVLYLGRLVSTTVSGSNGKSHTPLRSSLLFLMMRSLCLAKTSEGLERILSQLMMETFLFYGISWRGAGTVNFFLILKMRFS